ncbi:MAG: phosphatidylserine decarboxylase [Alphaproteobacteria bacterium]|nr:phosphatidylserine decarboxylase [Alphaproteobacteria bacterium]
MARKENNKLQKKSGHIGDVLVPIHPAGYIFVFLFALVTVGSALLLSPWLLIATVPLTLWCIYFFRDPERVPPVDSNVIISPADGVIQTVAVKTLPPELQSLAGKGPYTRVSIFMNVFNVHVNRMPCQARVVHNHYHAGKFLNASFDKASNLNERQSLWLRTNHSTNIGLVQIAGLVARRILCQASEGTTWRIGQRFGMIRFGSRVDVYLPKGYHILVRVGQTAVAGETRLAELKK